MPIFPRRPLLPRVLLDTPRRALAPLAACAALAAVVPHTALAQAGSPPSAQPGQASAAAAPGLTYADLIELSTAADVVMRATVSDQAVLKPDRAPGLAAGQARLYLETATTALLKAPGALGGANAFLADLPLDARGKAPKMKKRELLVFAREVPGRPGELQLIGPHALQPADPALEQRVRGVLTQLAESSAAPLPTGIRDVISVPGNLAGESETQMFIETAGGTPVSLSVIRRPGMEPVWGVSWSEIVDQSVSAPASGTIEWYRLACHLPRELPRESFLQDDPQSRARANEDYRLILQSLGPCTRTIAG